MSPLKSQELPQPENARSLNQVREANTRALQQGSPDSTNSSGTILGGLGTMTPMKVLVDSLPSRAQKGEAEKAKTGSVRNLTKEETPATADCSAVVADLEAQIEALNGIIAAADQSTENPIYV